MVQGKKSVFLVWVILFVSIVSFSVFAKELPKPPLFLEAQAVLNKHPNPCAADIKNYCGDKVEKSDKLSCLKQNLTKFNDSCRPKIDRLLKEESVFEICTSDIGALCKNQPKGQGEQLLCMEENKEKLGSSCSAAYEEHLKIFRDGARPGNNKSLLNQADNKLTK